MRHRSVVCALLIGCGGGEGGLPTRAITAEEALPLCEARCEYRRECGEVKDPAICSGSCVADLAGLTRRDATEAFIGCELELPCGASDDVCLAFVEPLEIHLEWEAACRTYLDTCPDLDVRCDATTEETGVLRMFAPEVMIELIACFNDPVCESVPSCMMEVFEAHAE
jgi:hypothetical protein